MALTEFQRRVCKIIAAQRIASGESYIAGGVALNEAISGARVSRDIDLFHDTDAALDASWNADRELLVQLGFNVLPIRERASFVEAEVSQHGESVLLQWVRDSAFRFFPLVEDSTFGLALHPFDLATNKVLALVGRVEVRDWVDTIACNDNLQPLGYLAWAACGKDPGFNPLAILNEAARGARYSKEEVDTLSFDGPPPDVTALSTHWRALLDSARAVVNVLPAPEAGKCVLDQSGHLLKVSPAQLKDLCDRGQVHFHKGSIRGALPQIVAKRV